MEIRTTLGVFALIALSACGGGGGGGGSSSGGGGTPTPVNQAPQFSVSANASVVENENFSLNISVTDPEGSSVTVTLLSGGDASLFSYDAVNRIVSGGPFDFDAPTDFNTDNVYEFTLEASDGVRTSTQTFQLTITNVPEGLTEIGTLALVGTDTNQDLGSDIQTIPDIDGDGRDELLVSMDRPPGSANYYQGALVLFTGKALESIADTYLTVEEELPDGTLLIDGDRNGESTYMRLGLLDDVDGDGREDFVIQRSPDTIVLSGRALTSLLGSGAPSVSFDTLSASADAVRIYNSSTPDTPLSRPKDVGDFDQDGRSELLVCQSVADPVLGYSVDRNYLIFGDHMSERLVTGGDIDVTEAVAQGDALLFARGQQDSFSCGGSAAGDFWVDGVDDLVLHGSLHRYQYQVRPGAFHVISGAAIAGLRGATQPIVYEDLLASGSVKTFLSLYDHVFGGTAVALGDVNGDGMDDLLMRTSPHNYQDQLFQAGESYVVFGDPTHDALSANGFGPDLNETNTQGIYLYHETTSTSTGAHILGSTRYNAEIIALYSAGDIDGDGLQDLMLAQGNSDGDGLIRSGETYIIYGKSIGAGDRIRLGDVGSSVEGVTLIGIDERDAAGTTAQVGDFNGDGQLDLAIAAPRAYPYGVQRGGEVYLISGTQLHDFVDPDGRTRLSSIFPAMDDPD